MLTGTFAIATIHCLSFFFSPEKHVPLHQRQDVELLTVFVLPKELQLLLLLSAQGVDDGDGQPQGLSRVAVRSQGVHPGARRGHVFWGDKQ